jgi:hypothetical protein
MLSQSIEREYRGFTIAGTELTANGRFDWFAVGRITVLHPNRVVHEVYPGLCGRL